MPESATKGFSSHCLRSEHRICRELRARCACTCHGASGQTPPKSEERTMPQPTRLQSVETDPTPTTPAQPGTAPRVELRRCDPPRSGRGSGLQRDIDAVLAGVRAEPGTWFQIATWPGASSASGWRKKLGDLHDDLELRALKDGRGSALYAKATPKAGSQ